MSYRQQTVRKRAIAVIFILFLFLAGGFLVQTGKYIPALLQLLFQKEIHLKTTDEKNINILLLGIGGGTHDGPDLTDTMIFASIDPASKKVTMVSIPRDLWMPELAQKINFAYADGEVKQAGGGIVAAKAAVQKLLGQDIDYVLRIDFDGFIKAVDMVGGLEVTVDKTLDDYKYPITGKETDSCGLDDEKIASLSAEIATGSASENEAFPCRYEHLHFDKGEQEMSGLEALKFVRSRHGENGEGSDFARSKRQEKVISAFKDKIFSVGTFLNPVKIVSLSNVLQSSIDTNIKENEYDDFVKLAQKLKGATLTSVVLDIGDESEGRFGILEQPPISKIYNNQYVLIPRVGNGNYSEIEEYVDCVIEVGKCIVTESGIARPTPKTTPSIKKN
jgi:polyisoprenyl-teichoic acid--peptidoglycan teichoic acid transferase